MHSRSLVVICIATLAILASSAAAAKQTQLDAFKLGVALRALAPNSDITSGIIDGMSYVAGSPAVCNKAHNDVSNNFLQGSYAIRDAFAQPGNVKDFERGLRLYGVGLVSVADSLEYCGLNTIVSNWTAVANQIARNPGTGVTNLLNAMNNRISSLHLPDLVQEIKDDLRNGHEYEAGVKIGTIVATILTPNLPNPSWFTFLQTLRTLTTYMTRR